jgi:hypothetical protein|nr:hypothetical protein [Candidatus Krumholzibacteria bacterium]
MQSTILVLILLLASLVLPGPVQADDPMHQELTRIVARFQEGEQDLALAAIDSLAHACPEDYRTHSVRGQLNVLAGHRTVAEAAFARTLELDPDNPDAIIHLKRLRFVPADFQPPTLLITDNFVLRPIAAADAELDHAALMGSVEHLQGTFGAGDAWPQGVTLEENRQVLAWHEQEFRDRSGFVYTVRSRFGDRCVGCVYIYPSRRTDAQADVLYWVTAEEAARGRDQVLGRDVRYWMENQWPLGKILYPGREMSWEKYLES